MEAAAKPTAVLRLYHAYSSFVRRRALACGAIFLLTIGLRFALRPWLPVPNPTIHDEFSYLLAGDTYAHGRLANPPHPLWQHFETFEEMQQPVYASKYPPLQGLALAWGEKVFDQPWMGVVVTSALMCAAVCWMLQGWISAEWALLGALLFTFRIGVLSYWMNSFEGGAITAIGGALALGAVVRIGQRREYSHTSFLAGTWALGLALMMHSRPYDAAVMGLASTAILVWLLRKSGARLIDTFWKIALPAFAVLALSLGAVAYNDVRVTGHALSLPYQVHDQQYLVASMFLFVPLRPEPMYRHAIMRDFYAGWHRDLWRSARSELVVQFLGRVNILLSFFFGFWPMVIPLLFWPPGKSMAERASFALLACSILSIAPLIGVVPHYAAGFAGVFYLRYLQSLSRLGTWRKPLGPALAAAIVALSVLAGRDSLSAALAQRSAHFGEARAAMNRNLAALPGRQLVLVRYAPGHNAQEEWVFNAADIDGSQVVWARAMGPDRDRELLDYYRDRTAWLLEPDRIPASLTPYPGVSDTRKEARR